jgi:hypothetical protein
LLFLCSRTAPVAARFQQDDGICGRRAVDDHRLAVIEAELDSLVEQYGIQEHARSREALVRGVNVRGLLAHELVDRHSINGTDHGAAREPGFLTADDDPSSFDLEQPEFQRPAIRLCIRELGVAVVTGT